MSFLNFDLTKRKLLIGIGILFFIVSGLLFFTNQSHIAIAIFGIGLIPIAVSVTITSPRTCAVKPSNITDQTIKI